MVGRQLPFFSLIVPFWLIAAYAGFRGMLEVWPALLVAGRVVRRAAVSRVELPRTVARRHRRLGVLDAGAGAFPALLARRPIRAADRRGAAPRRRPNGGRAAPPLRVALIPWIVLVIVVFAWGTPQVKSFLNHISSPNIPIAGLDKMVARVPPVVAKADERTGGLRVQLAVGDRARRFSSRRSSRGSRSATRSTDLVRRYVTTFRVVWRSLLTISAMLALGYTTRYSGEDAILGLAFAHTGRRIRSSRRCSAGSASR